MSVAPTTLDMAARQALAELLLTLADDEFFFDNVGFRCCR